MFTKRIIPCLDVHNGRVVKGTNFVNLKDAGDPVEVGAEYGRAGADELVFLDITASSDARAIRLEMVRRVAETVSVLRDGRDICRILRPKIIGVNKINKRILRKSPEQPGSRRHLKGIPGPPPMPELSVWKW